MAPLVRTGGSRHTGLAAPPQHNIQTIATHYIIINESYVENGSREYVYQIKFKDKSGNEVASTKVVDFYLIDTETLEITDEKTNDWH